MGGVFFASLHMYISIAKRSSLTILPDVHMYKAVSSNFRFAFMGSFRRGNVVMGIDVRWVSRGGRDVVCFYHKWMTSHNIFDFGVTCSTFISLCPNIRNTGLYFYLAFDIFKLRKNGENVFSQGPK